MNFKKFLANATHLEESHFIGDARPVIVGYAKALPLHIGYLPMFSEMLRLSEMHQADAILTFIRTTETDNELMYIAQQVQTQYGFLQVVIESDPMRSIVGMHSKQQRPIAILGDPILTEKAMASCKVVFGELKNIELMSGYLAGIEQICEQAVKDDDFNTFCSHSIVTDMLHLTNTFDALKESYGR